MEKIRETWNMTEKLGALFICSQLLKGTMQPSVELLRLCLPLAIAELCRPGQSIQHSYDLEIYCKPWQPWHTDTNVMYCPPRKSRDLQSTSLWKSVQSFAKKYVYVPFEALLSKRNVAINLCWRTFWCLMVDTERCYIISSFVRNREFSWFFVSRASHMSPLCL